MPKKYELKKKRVPLSWRPKPPNVVAFTDDRLQNFVEAVFSDTDVPSTSRTLKNAASELEKKSKLELNELADVNLAPFIGCLENQMKFTEQQLLHVYECLVNLSQGSWRAKNICMNFSVFKYCGEVFGFCKLEKVTLCVLFLVRNLTTIPSGPTLCIRDEILWEYMFRALSRGSPQQQYQVLCIVLNVSCIMSGKQFLSTGSSILDTIIQMFLANLLEQNEWTYKNLAVALACIGNCCMVPDVVLSFWFSEDFILRVIQISLTGMRDTLHGVVSDDATEEVCPTDLLSGDAVCDRRLVKLNATFVLCRLIDSKQFKTVADSPIALEALQSLRVIASQADHPGADDAQIVLMNMKIDERERLEKLSRQRTESPGKIQSTPNNPQLL